MKTKIFTVLVSQIALHVSKNAEKTLKNNSETIESEVNYLNSSLNLFCFHRNFCLRNTVQSSGMIQITGDQRMNGFLQTTSVCFFTI